MLAGATTAMDSRGKRSMSKAITEEAVVRLFAVLQGCYGNGFVRMWGTGAIDANGEDVGVVLARSVWLDKLRTAEVDGMTIKRALDRCADKHPTYPPTVFEFVALCKACKPQPLEPMKAPLLAYTVQKRDETFASLKSILKSAAARGFKPLDDGATPPAH